MWLFAAKLYSTESHKSPCGACIGILERFLNVKPGRVIEAGLRQRECWLARASVRDFIFPLPCAFVRTPHHHRLGCTHASEQRCRTMGPKKKQRLSDGTRASTKPVSTSSTRSRTRSTSAAPAASTTTPPASKKGKGKGKQTQTGKSPVKREQDALARLSPVWEADSAPKMTCWVEIPPLHPRPTEDELLFVRPRTITELNAKGKQREGALLHHLDRSAGKVDPFHFTEEDLRDESDGRQLFAFQPKPPKPRKTASTPRPTQPPHDGLEDLFLGSHAGPSTASAQPDQTRPLFFHGESDDEDARRNGPPSRTKPPVSQPKVKAEPAANGRQPNGLSKPSKSDKSRSQSAGAQPPASSREKKRSRSVERVRDEGAGKKRGDDIKNLHSELNEDAFARSTGPRHKEEYRTKLAALSQARKKAKLERGESLSASESDQAASKSRPNGRATSVSSGSDSGSGSGTSSGDSSDSSSSGDFIVGDDQIEYDEGFDPKDAEPARPLPSAAAAAANLPKAGSKYKRDSDGRIRLMPIHSHAAMSGSSSSVLAAHGLGLGARKGLDELCLDWLEWAVARVLVTWSSLSPADRERLERNRAALKSRTRSTEESVGSVAMRRQFKWYLINYPKMHVEALFTDEIDRFGSLAKQGCGICHRRSQKPQARVTFSGSRYNQQTLAPLSTQDDSSTESSESEASDRSDDDETWREPGTDAKGRSGHVFYAGNHCAHRAAVLHALHHWEWTAMQTLARHESIRYIRRQLWRKSRNGRGKDGAPAPAHTKSPSASPK